MHFLKVSAVLVSTALFWGCAKLSDPQEERASHINRMNTSLTALASQELTGPVDLKKCLAIAMRNNYDVRKATLNEELAHYDKNLAFSNFLPQITASAGISTRSRELMSGDMIVADKTIRDCGFNASMPLFAPATWMLYANSSLAEEQTALAGYIVRQGITLEVTSLFYNCLITEDEITTLESQVEANRSEYERIQGLAKEGLARQWESEMALYQYRNRQASLNTAKRNLGVYKSQLLMSMGMSPSISIDLERPSEEFALPDESLEELVLKALSTHPQLAIADRAVVQGENSVRMAIANFLPGVSGFVNGSWTSDSFTTHCHNLLGGFSVALDVFKGFSNIAKYKSAKVGKKLTENERDALMLSIIVEVTKAEADLRTAQELMELSEIYCASTKSKYTDYDKKLKEGLVPIHEMLEARSEMDNAQALNVRLRYTRYIRQANLAMAMGTLEPVDVTPLSSSSDKRRRYGERPTKLLLNGPGYQVNVSRTPSENQ